VALVIYHRLYCQRFGDNSISFVLPPKYHQLHVSGKSMLQQLQTLDYIGIFLYTLGLVLFLIGLNWGGSSYPWASAQVLCTTIIGLFVLATFGFWEAYTKIDYPFMPMRLFLNVKYDAIVACAAVGAMVYCSRYCLLFVFSKKLPS
jgi:hypothetical protein